MTHDDLATLLREDVTASEPRYGLDAMVPVRIGRRRLRTRRLASGAGVAAVLVAGSAVAVPLVNGGDGPGPSRGMDPVSQAALDHYDAQRMPQLMDDHVRGVLERSVPDLAPVTFRATDGQEASLPPELYDKASTMSVTYGPEEHSWSVDISHSRGEAEGDPQRYCADGLDGGYYLTCTVETTPDGDVVISHLDALKPFRIDGHRVRQDWMAVPRDKLDSTDPAQLWFEHVVKVIKSKTLLTYVTERVHAPSRADAEARFATPLEDLVAIGTDPELVMPPPPTDDSGCGPWTRDEDVSYSC